MYRIYRALRNGGVRISEFEEIEEMVQDVLKNPNHIYAIKRDSKNGLYEYDVMFSSVTKYLGQKKGD